MKDIGYRNAVAVSSLPTASAALAGVTVRLTTDNKPYWCDGTQWVDLTATGSGGGSPGGSTGEIQYNNAGSFAGAANVRIESGNLKLMPTTIPVAPADGLVLFDRNRAGRHIPSIIGPSGVDVALQPALFGNSIYMWLPGVGTTLGINFGTSFTVRNSGASDASAPDQGKHQCHDEP